MVTFLLLQGKGGRTRAPASHQLLVAIMVVLVPIPLGVPAVFVLIPPAMAFPPATLSSLVQFAALVISLSAIAPVPLDGLVEFMVRVNDPPLTAVDVFCVKAWHCGGKQDRRQDRA